MSKQYRVSLPASRTELAQVLTRLQDDTLQEPDRQLLMRLLEQLLGPFAGTPGSRPVSAAVGQESEPTTSVANTASSEPENHESKPAGHGRRSADDYPGAERVRCHDPLRQPGDRCTRGGRLYQTSTPAVFLRFTGQPLVGATC